VKTGHAKVSCDYLRNCIGLWEIYPSTILLTFFPGLIVCVFRFLKMWIACKFSVILRRPSFELLQLSEPFATKRGNNESSNTLTMKVAIL